MIVTIHTYNEETHLIECDSFRWKPIGEAMYLVCSGPNASELSQTPASNIAHVDISRQESEND